jgi:hygromycin-B 4-O-kinase
MKPVVTDAELGAFLEVLYRRRVEVQSLTEGMDSRACAFDLHGEAFVLRVGPSRSGFVKDCLAYERFRSDLVPIPEVLAIGKFGRGLDYCVSRRLPGVTLQDAPEDFVQRTLDVTVDVMEAIWVTDISFTSGFGTFDPSGKGPDPTWRSHLERIANEAGATMRAVIGERAAARILGAFLELSRACPEERCLYHRDFGANNVLTDGHRITGVLDWDAASCGDPLWDVGTALFWATWLPCFGALEHHCRRRLSDLPHYRERVLCYALAIGLCETAGDEGRRVGAWAGRRCLELLDAERWAQL